jgi:hypothetical protein
MGLTLTWTALMNVAAVVQAQEHLALWRMDSQELVAEQLDEDESPPRVQR